MWDRYSLDPPALALASDSRCNTYGSKLTPGLQHLHVRQAAQCAVCVLVFSGVLFEPVSSASSDLEFFRRVDLHIGEF